jgi:2,5-diamino-6-(ribosylamino)-4(3H)-pyrimidinone 5'-phosphate reductase
MVKHRKLIHIAINMAMSADGKISTARRESFSLGSSRDRQMMSEIRARAGAVIIGAHTLTVDGFPLVVRDASLRTQRIARGLPPHPVNVILSTTLNIPHRKKIFSHPQTDRIIYTTRKATRSRIERFKQVAEVVVLPAQTISPKRIVDDLAKRGVKDILVEGGGEINYSFLKANLVDELYITLTPSIIGGRTSPTVVDGAGFLKDSRILLSLISARRYDDEVFLRYRVLDA